MNVVHVQGHVGLQYTHPQITDSMISRNDFRYAVYAKCGSDSNLKMIRSGIRNTYYSIADLPEETLCRVKLVAYSNDCPLEIEGKLSVETTFTKPPSSECMCVWGGGEWLLSTSSVHPNCKHWK